MSTPALALPVNRVSRRQRRRQLWARVPLQWHVVPVADSSAFVGRTVSPPRRWLIALAVVAVVVAHVLGVWIGQRYALIAETRPKPKTLAVEIVHPPKPPKVEPPPPPPPKIQHKAPPPIQTSVVASNVETIAAPVEAVAPVVAAPPAPPPAPEPVKAAFGGIGYKNNPAPDYPSQAVRQGWQGTVLLRVKVLQTGAVDSIEVVKSSGKKVLDDAAIHTVERWVFAPSTRGTTPIDGFATVPIEFKLDS